MVEAMQTLACLDVELTVEERNLLSVAYKNVIGARRASWRIISSIEQKEESKSAEEKLEMIRSYRIKVHLGLSPPPPPRLPDCGVIDTGLLQNHSVCFP